MAKRDMGLLERARVARRIFQAVAGRDSFLLLGHKNPDEDCVSSLVASALLLKKMHKQVHVLLSAAAGEHLAYLLAICSYNSIGLIDPAREEVPPESRFDAAVICDTPKPEMIDAPGWARAVLGAPEVLKIEIDHHLGADSQYCGDPGYCMVTEASSASELVGRLALQLRSRRDLLYRYQIEDPFSRNFVLAVLTGIIGDSKMGRFLTSRRQKRYYRRFSRMFNRLLARETVREGNFADMEQVFRELQRLPEREQRCFDEFMRRKMRSTSVSYVALDAREVESLGYDDDTIVSVARAVADALAEDSGRLGLVAYADPPGRGEMVEFRLRRSKDYKRWDLRQALDLLGIRSGGGHEGAIGFRLPRREVPDLRAKVRWVVERLEAVLPDGRRA